MSTDFDESKMKAFNWNSEQSAKAEYPDWFNQLTCNLSLKGIVYCLNQHSTNRYRPLEIGPQPMQAAQLAEWRKRQQAYQSSMIKFHTAFDMAIGLLRRSLKYPSKAATDIEEALNVPQNIDPQEWSPELQFRAAMEVLKKYAPRDATDVSEIRSLLQNLSDTNEGGFHTYATEFVKLLQQLKSANAVPTATELSEWVKKSLKNEDVKRHLSATVLRTLEPATYETIFDEVRLYLKNMGDADPYKSAKGGPVSKPMVAAGTFIEKRCTRCWRNGHSWNQCTAKTCSSCSKPLEGKFCGNYANHTVPGTNWAPKFLTTPKSPTPSIPTDPNPVTPSPSNVTQDDIKKARKALQVMIKTAKRQKTGKG